LQGRPVTPLRVPSALLTTASFLKRRISESEGDLLWPSRQIQVNCSNRHSFTGGFPSPARKCQPRTLFRILGEFLSRHSNLAPRWRPIRVARIAVEQERTGFQDFLEPFLAHSHHLVVVIRANNLKVIDVTHATLTSRLPYSVVPPKRSAIFKGKVLAAKQKATCGNPPYDSQGCNPSNRRALSCRQISSKMVTIGVSSLQGF
jgi:hypothetical protein